MLRVDAAPAASAGVEVDAPLQCQAFISFITEADGDGGRYWPLMIGPADWLKVFENRQRLHLLLFLSIKELGCPYSLLSSGEF